MGNYRNFTLATYFVAQAAARVTEAQLEEQLGFILYPFVMDGVQRQLVRAHVKGASALRVPGREAPILPLYREGDEAVFSLEALPGRFTVYQIITDENGGVL